MVIEVIRLTNWRISCEGARGSRRASSQQYQARRLSPQERALGSCMRWLGRGSIIVPLLANRRRTRCIPLRRRVQNEYAIGRLLSSTLPSIARR